MAYSLGRRLSCWSDGNERLQLEEALLTDAANVHELLAFLEATILLPMLDDPLRRLGTDAWQRLELRNRRSIQVDEICGHRGRTRRR